MMNGHAQKLKSSVLTAISRFGVKRAALLLVLCLMLTFLPMTMGRIASAEGADAAVSSGTDVSAADTIETDTSETDVTTVKNKNDLLAPAEKKPVTVHGLTLVSQPDKFNDSKNPYFVGEHVDLGGMVLEITYVYDEDSATLGDKAPLNRYTLRYTSCSAFVDVLEDFGIKCNYADYSADSISQKTLSLANNTESMKFYYGEDPLKVFDTGICPLVKAYSDDSSGLATVYDDGVYIVVVDGKCVMTNKPADSGILSDASLTNTLNTQTLTIDNTAGVIRNLTSQLNTVNEGKKEAEKLLKDDIQWTADFSSANGDCTVTLSNSSAALSGKEVNESSITKNGWALVTDSAATEWSYDNNHLYCVIESADSVVSIDETDIDVKKYVCCYVALSDAGYLYLTTDAAKAARIDFYKDIDGADTVESIVVIKDADKMAYSVGEAFDPAGMIVNIVHDDSSVDYVPYSLFNAYDITVEIDNMDSLTAAENGKHVKVRLGDVSCNTISPLTVTSDESQFILSDGKITSGLYAIVWAEIDGRLAPDTTYNGIALTSDEIDVTDSSGNSLSTLSGEAAAFKNNILANSTTVWQVTSQATGKYTISIPGTSIYLNRQTAGENEQGRAGLALGEMCEDSYWRIDGSVDASIEFNSILPTDDNCYIVSVRGSNAGESAFAVMNPAADSYPENFYFFKKVDTPTTPPASPVPQSLDVVDKPDTDYKAGEKLDLSDMVVKITYSDGTSVKVAYDDFSAYGLTVNYADGASLTTADNNKNIVVSLGSLKATVAALKVTASSSGSPDTPPAGKDDGATPSTGDVTHESNHIAIAATANLALISLMVIILAVINRDQLMLFFETRLNNHQ